VKKLVYLSLAFLGGAALAGWGAAKVDFDRRQRRAEEKARLAVEAEMRKWAKTFAAAARSADEVVFSSRAAGGEEVVLADHGLIADLAKIMEGASYTRTEHGLWISSPVITFRHQGSRTLELMALGGVLRAYTDHGGGDFIVRKETVTALFSAVQRKVAATLSVSAEPSLRPAAERATPP
jgi:hypothetical protein